MKTSTIQLRPIILAIVLSLCVQVSILGQTKVPLPTGDIQNSSHSHKNDDSIYREPLDGCTANDFTVDQLYLADISGNPIPNSCTPGSSQSAYIFAVFSANSNAGRYSLYIDYDVYINGVFSNHVNECLNNRVEIPINQEVLVQQVNYNCGDVIEFKNYYMSWATNSNKDCGTNPSHCYFTAPGFIIDAPLIANFDYTTTCNTFNINLSDLTTGGDLSNSYSYAWDINNDGSFEYTTANPTHTFPGSGTYDVNLVVTDFSGNTDSQVYNVSINPSLQGLTAAVTDIDCNGNDTGTITASGVTGGIGSYTYSISPQPFGYIQNGNVFSNLSAGTYTITVTDEQNCSIDIPVTINVLDGQAPTIIAPIDTTIEGCDVDDIINNNASQLAYSETAVNITETQFLAEGGAFTESNVDTITYIDSSTGTCIIVVTRTYEITDDCGEMASAVRIISIEDTIAPVFNESLPSDDIVECDNVPVADVLTAIDNCAGAATVSMTETTSGDADACPSEYTITRTWTALDTCGNTISHIQVLTVEDNTAPTFNEDIPLDDVAECDNIPVAVTLTASDNCDANIDVVFTETINGDTDACPSEYTIIRTWSITDCAGNTDSHTQTITVEDNSAPTFNETLPSDDTVECDNVPAAATLTASDNCDASISVVFTETTSGDTDACPSEYTITRTWSITDCAGNTDSHIQTITVEDNTAPTFNETPLGDVTEECDAVTPALTLTATDNCDSNVVVNFNEQRTDGSCPSNYTLVRTWTVSDCAGNTTTHTQNVTVQDTTAPVLSTVAADQTVQCDGSGNSNQLQAWLDTNAGAIATDNCGTVSWSNNFTGLTDNCGETGVALVTFTATDECGNTTISTALFTILDLVPPTMDTEASDMTLECDAANNDAALQAWISSNGGASASDICSNVTWTNDFTALSDDCGATGSATVTFTATDDCGNAISTSASFNIQDTTDPIFNETLPADITEECDLVTSPITLTATDNCGNAIVTFEELKTDGSCVSDYILTRTWTATDDCGNTAIHTQTVTVQDNTAPTMDVEASDIAIECDGSGNNGAIDTWLNNNGGASASDSCGTVTWTNNYGGQTSDCATPIDVIFTATDECGNQTTTTASYAIQDTDAPTIDVEASNLTEECDGSGNAAALQAWLDNNGGASASDNCSAIAWDNDFNGLSDDCGATGSTTVTFTVTDGCGNSSSTTATFSIEDNTVPTFNETLPSEVTEECDAITSPATLTASDSCGEATVTFNEIRTDGSCDSNYTLERTWTATDACGNATSHTQTVNVQDNTAPTFNEALPSNITQECDAVSSAETLTAADNCGNANVTFEETRIDGACASDYLLTRTWTATDDCGNTTSHTQTITIQNSMPTLNVEATNIVLACDGSGNNDAMDTWLSNHGGATVSNSCGNIAWTHNYAGQDPDCSSPVVVTFTATDDCGNQMTTVASYTIEDSNAPIIEIEASDLTVECDGSGNTAALQDWLDNNGGASANDDCSAITWSNDFTALSDDCGATGSATVTFTATDGCGNSSDTSATFSIEDTTNPVFNETLPDDITVECDILIGTSITLTASDSCGDASVTFNEIRTDGSCPSSYTLSRTWTATDACGNSTSHSQIVTVEDNTPPVFNETLPLDITIECDTLIGSSVILTATDNCGDATVVFDEVKNDGSCPSSYTLTRTWTASDGCGNTTSHTQTVTVEDTTAPILENLPSNNGNETSNAVIECDNIPEAANVTAIDNCDPSVDVILTETTVEGNCPGSYQLLRTWTATDNCGNSSEFTQTLTIQDLTPPTFVEDLPQNENYECSDVPEAITITAIDNCTNATVTLTETQTDGNCPGTFVITRIWVASDECNNQVTHTQVITAQDTTAPEFNEELPVDVIVECDDIPEVPTLTVTDNCGNAMLEFNEETVDGDCPSNYTITRTWTATDDCDNAAVHIQTITVQDTTAPLVTSDYEEEISVSCGDIPEAPELEFEDACSSDISVSYEETSTQNASGNDYEIIREWTVSDACNNTALYSQTVFVNTDSNVGGTDTDLCNGDDIRFDLFNLLTGDYGFEGVWTVSPSNATIEDGHYFNPLGLDIGLYIFTYTDDVSTCPSETMVEIELNDECIVLPCGDADEVIISKAVTANGDNINDYFTVEGIESCGFTVQVQIYNRWGAKIYESKNYQNNWNGTSHGNSIGGSDKVPTGTYYYIINLVDSGLKPFAGPIYVGTK
ncbi:MAG: gliding motility-associated C-terminal domain-containing protein [Flavobacteriaceae bacterium]|nr:gliding motility-associated C-terminal domain-containing protein [Flavobacteriaceae bacterium]